MSALDFAALLREEKRKAAASKVEQTKANAAAGELWRKRPEVRLEKYVLDCGVPKVWYIPDYVTAEEEAQLLGWVDSDSGRWTQLAQRRLQTWGGTPHPSGIVKEALPGLLDAVAEGLGAAVQAAAPSVYAVGDRPDHILLNEYTGGKGIAPHLDGTMYHPCAAVISLAGPCVIEFEPRAGGPKATVCLQPRSLLIFAEEAYSSWMHAIPSRDVDEIGAACCNRELAGVREGDRLQRAARRVSVTYRRVAVPTITEDFTVAGKQERQRRENWFLTSVNEGGAKGNLTGGYHVLSAARKPCHMSMQKTEVKAAGNSFGSWLD
eukprot:TRINITY_DN40522_c0_g1_i1.p1 TRINITY_DN40522_c0_g1~~TRINITY_DN40522_c0_g1_i1.p1  ORF type:complete len:321 (-),score=70.45 TRINITY_DN40522_c0_g1_i1:275-1237(-)